MWWKDWLFVVVYTHTHTHTDSLCYANFFMGLRFFNLKQKEKEKEIITILTKNNVNLNCNLQCLWQKIRLNKYLNKWIFWNYSFKHIVYLKTIVKEEIIPERTSGMKEQALVRSGNWYCAIFFLIFCCYHYN